MITACSWIYTLYWYVGAEATGYIENRVGRKVYLGKKPNYTITIHRLELGIPLPSRLTWHCLLCPPHSMHPREGKNGTWSMPS